MNSKKRKQRSKGKKEKKNKRKKKNKKKKKEKKNSYSDKIQNFKFVFVLGIRSGHPFTPDPKQKYRMTNSKQ